MTTISRWGLALAAGALAVSFNANAQDRHYRFAHDQQLNSGYSVAYDIFSAKLKELSGGKMLVDQYPGAQLGQEPQLLQLVKSGDLDFAIRLAAYAAAVALATPGDISYFSAEDLAAFHAESVGRLVR